MSTEAIVVLCTFGNEEKAAHAAFHLVEVGLAACVNLLPEVRSVYRWGKRISDTRECLAVIKTSAARFEDLRARLCELHDYEIPEVIALPVVAGHAPYLEWLAGNSTGAPPADD